MNRIIIPFVLCFFPIVAGLYADDAPTANWTLTGGAGQQLPGGVLEISGTGSDSNAWLSEPLDVKPGEIYRFSMEASSPDGEGGGGCAPCGLEGFSRDYAAISRDWKPFSFIFKAPQDRKEFRMRVGQWQANRTFRFRNMKIEKVEPIDRGLETEPGSKHFILLGDGEMIRNGKYTFNGSFGGPGANVLSRFVSTTSGFNSDRFTVNGPQEIVFGFDVFACKVQGTSDNAKKSLIEGFSCPLRSRKIEVNVNYHVRGECIVYASRLFERKDKTELGRIDKVGTISASIPDSTDAEPIFITIQGSPDASFQVNGVNFEADVDIKAEGVGETVFADVLPQNENAPEGYSSQALFFDEQRTLYVEHRNDSESPVKPLITNPPDRMPGRYKFRFYTFSEPFDMMKVEMPPRSVCIETKPFFKAPEFRVPFSDRILQYSFPYNPYRDADFGYYLFAYVGDDIGEPMDGVWWAEPDWKISPVKPAPKPMAGSSWPVAISAAKNDFESFQLVVNGREDGVKNVMLSVDGDLEGPDGATIPAANIQLRYVYYHFVQRPTDETGLAGYWPDALPPLEKPLDVAPGKNQPFWITVYVPENAQAGIYQGRVKISLTENEKTAEYWVPFGLKVWNFALPRKNTLQTAFGRNAHKIFQYHNCKTEEDKRAVLELYHQLYSDYRISVYNPTPLDPIRVDWDFETKSAKLDFTAFDREMERILEKYNITNFMVPVQGMPWGTFEERGAGRIGQFEEGSPEYEALFSDYVGKLEAHLKEKGWLDMAYTYWFDEPDPKDYEFVAKGFARLQKYAPGLARMITEEPNPGFIEALEKEGAKIDIWCPVSYNVNDEDIRARQKLNEKIWWYVCTGPKAPYCTLFIDHPGTELRVWHWQTFQRDIVGTLIWDTNYWTSPSAFPENSTTPFQNPYEDPMGYVAGGPPGSKRYWGNGDGRFVYPPLEAAVPGLNDGKPVIKPPVASIRWEMIREGIEDFEMLSMLRELKAKHLEAEEKIDTLLILPADITSGLTEFTTDPAPIYRRRERIAELIESLDNIRK